MELAKLQAAAKQSFSERKLGYARRYQLVGAVWTGSGWEGVFYRARVVPGGGWKKMPTLRACRVWVRLA
jgi:hypothetical protein